MINLEELPSVGLRLFRYLHRVLVLISRLVQLSLPAHDPISHLQEVRRVAVGERGNDAVIGPHGHAKRLRFVDKNFSL